MRIKKWPEFWTILLILCRKLDKEKIFCVFLMLFAKIVFNLKEEITKILFFLWLFLANKYMNFVVCAKIRNKVLINNILIKNF